MLKNIANILKSPIEVSINFIFIKKYLVTLPSSKQSCISVKFSLPEDNLCNNSYIQYIYQNSTTKFLLIRIKI